jgi:glycosyltransferase involved in cell wall biosynthesis
MTLSNPQPAISVALCTYNGAEYLPEQLQSLAAQTQKPDELVVFDDASSDGTIFILRAFAASNPGFEVRIEQNTTRHGSSQNFQRAIAACRGSVIALCDQDDIWEPEKLALIAAEFRKTPTLGLVFTDAEICDDACRPLGYRLWQSVGFTPAMRRRLASGRAFEVILRQNVVTGATMAFSSALRDLVLPVDNLWVHDGWIALLASAVAPVAVLPRPLVRYRQHASQSIGALRRTLYQQYLNAKKLDAQWFAEHAGQYEAAMHRLEEKQLQFPTSPRTLRLLEEKISHWKRRTAIKGRSIARFLPSLTEFLTLRYGRFSLGWKSFAQDLFL